MQSRVERYTLRCRKPRVFASALKILVCIVHFFVRETVRLEPKSNGDICADRLFSSKRHFIIRTFLYTEIECDKHKEKCLKKLVRFNLF